MAENIKVNELEIAASLKDTDRVLALTDEENNEVKTVSKQNLIGSLISTAENNLLSNNGGLYVDGNTISALIEALQTLQAQQADEIGRPIFTLSNTLLENEIWLEGATVSREQYAQLFEVYGTTYGAGNGSTTFKLPDYRNRAIWGASNFGYVDATLPNFTAAFSIGEGAYFSSASGAAYLGAGQSNEDPNKAHVGPSTVIIDPSRVSSIYSNGATVRPPAIKHRVKTRFK